jgi:antitoxin Xre/MbcA/ParS-like protein
MAPAAGCPYLDIRLHIWYLVPMAGAETARGQVAAGLLTPPELRHRTDVRRKKSAPALRAFFAVASRWRLAAEEERALLGWPPRSTFHKWKSGNPGTLPYDTLIRISLVLGIYKALHILYPEAAFADGWVRMANTNPLFAGHAPLEVMVAGDVEAIYAVRRLLDGRRG